LRRSSLNRECYKETLPKNLGRVKLWSFLLRRLALTPSLRFFKLAKEQARERMLGGTLAEKSAGVEKGRATEVIARQVGFSNDLVEMAIWITERIRRL
jgi:hypothetical protein